MALLRSLAAGQEISGDTSTLEDQGTRQTAWGERMKAIEYLAFSPFAFAFHLWL